MKLEIEKTLVVSISHLKKSDVRKLEENELINSDGYSLSFYIGGEGDFDFEFYSVPKYVAGLIELAKENDCTRIKFDRDADTVEGFETFDW